MPVTLFDTALGPAGVAWHDAGITAIQLPEASRAATRARLLAKAPGEAREVRERALPPWIRDTVARLRTHLDGCPQDLSAVRLDFGGVTPFSARIYAAARRVPAGRTVSYGELARCAGSPDQSFSMRSRSSKCRRRTFFATGCST